MGNLKLSAAVLVLALGCSESDGPTAALVGLDASPEGAAGGAGAVAATDSAVPAVDAGSDSATSQADAGIPCEAFSADDDDSDGVLNGCDLCPMGSDADEDRNGYPDLCDVVMWSQRVRAANTGAVHDALMRVQVIESEGKPPRVFAEYARNVELDADGGFDVTSAEGIGTIEEAITPTDASGDVNRVRVSVAWNLGADEAEHVEQTALVEVNVLTRVRIRGKLTADAVDVTFELRGYRGFL
jgi:hypothetical protein